MTTLDGLAAARRVLRRERRRTVDEREAFAAFREAVVDVPAERDRPTSPVTPTAPLSPTSPVPSSGPQTGTGGGTAAVRDAYERTVMAVPHYEEEYGDSTAESLAAEFCPEAATGLVEFARLTPWLKRGVVDGAETARLERERFVEGLDAEADSLCGSEDRLAAVHGEVGSLADEPVPDFGAQDAVRARLGVLADRCDAVAADRQAALREWQERFDAPVAVPDLPRYLYADLDATYPVLATVAAVGERVDRLRRRVEREMATPSSGATLPRDDADV